MPSSILTSALAAGSTTPSQQGGEGGGGLSFVSRMVASGALSQLTFVPPSQPATPSGARTPVGRGEGVGVGGGGAAAAVAEKRPLSYDVGKALLIFREMVDTESRFVAAMRTLVAVFIEPLQALSSAPSSSPSRLSSIALHPQVQIFFSTATQILTLNSQLSEELSSHLSTFSEATNVGEIFLHYAPLFRCYGLYASSHERVSAQLLASSRNDSAFRTFVEQATADLRCRGQTLESLLIMPIQRIPRYRLLLEELRKKTPDSHPGYDSLNAALCEVNDAAVHLNETIRRRENREKLSELSERWVAGSREALDLCEGDVPRVLVREGELTRMTRRGSTVYYFHLFTDLLLYSESTVKGYKLHRRVDLSDRVSVQDRGHSDAEPHAILLTSPQKSFVVCAKTDADKRDWLSDLTRCIQQSQSNLPERTFGSHSLSRHGRSNSTNSVSSAAEGAEPAFVAPLWTSDHSASHCTVCAAAFTFFNRRHHCRQCGVLVCSSCSSRKLLLPAIHPTDMQRVCDKCYKADEAAGGPHCAVAGCSNRREKGPFCASHAAAATSHGGSPSSKMGRGSTSLIGRARFIATKKVESVGAVDKHPFSHSLPFPSDWRDKVDTQLSSHPSDPRLPLIADLYTAEMAYLADLHGLLELYVKPLLRLMESSQSTSKGRRSEVAEIDGRRVTPMLAVFLTGVESLYDLSVEVAKQLGSRVEEWRAQLGIGDLFLRYGSLFQLYLQYGRGWRGALRELEGLGSVVRRLEEEARRKMRLSVEKLEREREESRRESRIESRRYEEHKEEEDDDDPTASVNHSGKVSFDPAAIAQAALRAKKSRDLRLLEASNSATSSQVNTPKAGASLLQEEDEEPKDVSPVAQSHPQPSASPAPLSVVIPVTSSSPPTVAPKPLLLPDQSPNPVSPSSPSTPVSRNSASSRTCSLSALPPSSGPSSPSSSLLTLSSSPLHRLTQYHSTLTSLLTVTPLSHPDHVSLASALSVISSLHAQLVRVLLDGENAFKMQQLQQRFVAGGGKDWVRESEERRSLLYEGKAERVRQSGGAAVAVYLHLLSDALLMSEETGKGMFKLSKWMPLSAVQVTDEGKGVAGDGGGLEWRMQVITPAKAMVLGLATEGEKVEWLKRIKAAVKDLYVGGKKKEGVDGAAAALRMGMSRSASRSNLVDAVGKEKETELVMEEKEPSVS